MAETVGLVVCARCGSVKENVDHDPVSGHPFEPMSDEPAEPIDEAVADLREYLEHAVWPQLTTVLDALAEAKAEIERLRETNARLNRRCQSAESGLAVKLDEVKRQGGSFGRALAFAGYTKAEAENAELRDALKLAKEFAQVEVDEFNAQTERIAKLEAALATQTSEALALARQVRDHLQANGPSAKPSPLDCFSCRESVKRIFALASPSEPAGRKGEAVECGVCGDPTFRVGGFCCREHEKLGRKE